LEEWCIAIRNVSQQNKHIVRTQTCSLLCYQVSVFLFLWNFKVVWRHTVYNSKKSWGTSKSQAGASYCSRSCRWLGPSRPYEGPTEHQDLATVLEEVEAGQHTEWKNIADWSPIYKGYWDQWKSIAVRDGMLEHHWESTSRWSKVAEIVLLQCKVKEVLAELHGELSGGHLVFNSRGTTGFRQDMMMKSGAGTATPVQPTEACEPGVGAVCISTSELHSRGQPSM
jgi:hypothetical protein